MLPERVKEIPYGRQTVDEKDVAAVVEVLLSDRLTTGPAVSTFERAMCDFTKAEWATAVSSGTAALHCAFKGIGLNRGDEVILPPLTFAATANAVIYCGANPVFADIDYATGLLNPEEAEKAITPRTKAVIGVDYAGQPCDWEELGKICRRHGLKLLADSAHSLGATVRGESPVELVDAAVFSFHPVKHITTGEGGMVVSNDEGVQKRVARFRNHGIDVDANSRQRTKSWVYGMEELGFNYRMTDIQAALGTSQLEKLPVWLGRRRDIAEKYDSAFGEMEWFELLETRSEVNHAYHLYVLRLKKSYGQAERQKLYDGLRRDKIGVNVHYMPVYLHPYYQREMKFKKGLCPQSEAFFERVVSLPMYPALSDSEVDMVIRKVASVCQEVLS